MESLQTVWVSRANVQQRKGRAGRVMPGVCIHLFTRHRYNYQFLGQPVPELHRVPLEQIILRVQTLPHFAGRDPREVMGKHISYSEFWYKRNVAYFLYIWGKLVLGPTQPPPSGTRHFSLRVKWPGHEVDH
jgi:hypothetical protein